MLSLCKVPLNACGVSTEKKEYEKSSIWQYVKAAMASMRVDACTNEVKECLQATDRCGSDYSQCVGLDTDTIMRMCPYEKMVGCQKVYGNEKVVGQDVYNEISDMVQGVMLNIDNNMLELCQKAVDNAMIKVCGDTENCDSLAVDEGVGTRSFKYQVCQYKSINGNNIEWGALCRDSLEAINEQELTNLPDGIQGWAGKLSGLVYWGDITYSQTQNAEGGYDFAFTSDTDYINKLKANGNSLSSEDENIIKERVFGQEIRSLQNAVLSAINAIESDPTVQYCMTGREVQGMRSGSGVDAQVKKIGDKSQGGRFPQLTQQIRSIIAASALKIAKANYNSTYDKETKRMMQDQVKAAKRVDHQAALNVARNTCEAWAESSSLPVSESPKMSNAGKWIALGLIIAAAVVVSVFTFGAGAAIGGSAIAVLGTSMTVGTAVSLATVAAGSIAAAGIAASTAEPVGKSNVEQWNYKENVTTMFNPQTGECIRIRIAQNCKTVKKNYCQYWEDPEEFKETVNLMDEED